MDLWYNFLAMLPFEWAEPGKMMFMKNALLAVIVISPLFGMLSTMIVNNRMAFFSDALGHGAFTGMVIGVFAGFLAPTWWAIFFSIVFSIIVTLVKVKTRLSGDTVIGVFSSLSVALGIFLATLGGRGFAKLNKYLVGDILSISSQELIVVIVVLAIVLLFWMFIINRLVMLSVHTTLASSRGIGTFWTEAAFAALIAVVVTLSMSWVGLLVINSFLVLPAATARNISSNMRTYNLFAVLSALLSGISGLFAAYYFGTVAGATIILILGLLFFGTLVFRRKFA